MGLLSNVVLYEDEWVVKDISASFLAYLANPPSEITCPYTQNVHVREALSEADLHWVAALNSIEAVYHEKPKRIERRKRRMELFCTGMEIYGGYSFMISAAAAQSLFSTRFQFDELLKFTFKVMQKNKDFQAMYPERDGLPYRSKKNSGFSLADLVDGDVFGNRSRVCVECPAIKFQIKYMKVKKKER